MPRGVYERKRWMRRGGPPCLLQAQHVESILRRRAEGATLTDIGRRYGVSRRVVSRFLAKLHRAGITLRLHNPEVQEALHQEAA